MVELDKKYDFNNLRKDRGSGILMHISSLPGPYGIGSLGKEAREFADFLQEAGQKYWQVLPLGPTSYGDSPYASYSSFAGNPYFIDLEDLKDKGLLTQEDMDRVKENYEKGDVDYEKLYHERNATLYKAFERFDKKTDDFIEFSKKNSKWLEDYSLFMVLKDLHQGRSWMEWEEKYRLREKEGLDQVRAENKEKIDFYKFTQYIFYKELRELKDYLGEKEIKIIGDLPIYVAEDSCDIWANPRLFQLDEDLRPSFVGGCPPDGFSEDGQLWGNPVYKWEAHKEEGYAWWIERISWALRVFDTVRIDHFRGFESYWRVPAGDKTAAGGEWVKGPDYDLFQALKEKLGEVSIIAEDLGYVTEEVFNFKEKTGFPGMKVLQFAFNPYDESDYLPHNITENSVVYTGTHDNDTIKGWLENVREEELQMAKTYLNLSEEEGYNWGMIRGAMTSVAKMAIFQAQDLLFLDNSSRMNNPGILGGNWQWRLEDFEGIKETAKRLRDLAKFSGRV